MRNVATSSAILNLRPMSVKTTPFEHVIVDGSIKQPFYGELAVSEKPQASK